MKKQNSHLFLYSGIVVLCTLTYSNVFNADFIAWDDREVLLQNQDVHQFNLVALFTKHYVGNYAPVTMLGFALDWALFHGASVWHHLVNVILHSVNSILVFWLTFQLFKNRYRALFTSLVFCIHPLQVETVAWVAAKNNTLYALFFLCACLFYIRYIRIAQKQSLRICLMFFCLSVLSKPSAICFPLCMVAFDMLKNRKLTNKLFLEKIPFIAVAALIGLVTYISRSQDNFLIGSHTFSWPERIGYAGYALYCYVSKFILPIHQSVVYPYPESPLVPLSIGYALIAGVIISAGYWLKTKQHKVMGVVVFFISNLLLVLQLIPFGEVLTADRYMYLPVMALCWLLLFLVKPGKQTYRYVLPALILILVPVTMLRTRVWKNSVTLYTDILNKYPNSFAAHTNLGAHYMVTNEDNKALFHLNKAIAISPGHYKAYYNRGLLYEKINRTSAALKDLTKAIELKNFGKAYAIRAYLYYRQKQYSKAMSDANCALSQDPKNTHAIYVLANSYSDLNQLDIALRYYNQIIDLKPEEADLYLQRAIIYGKRQQYNNCLSDLNIATNINPNFSEAYYWKGVARVNLKQSPCADFQKALALGFKQGAGPYVKYCQ